MLPSKECLYTPRIHLLTGHRSQQVELRQFVNELMVKTGGVAQTGWPIASCKIYPDKNYAFLEFRSVEEATNCMAFDGAGFKDSYLRVRGPAATAACFRGLVPVMQCRCARHVSLPVSQLFRSSALVAVKSSRLSVQYVNMRTMRSGCCFQCQ